MNWQMSENSKIEPVRIVDGLTTGLIRYQHVNTCNLSAAIRHKASLVAELRLPSALCLCRKAQGNEQSLHDTNSGSRKAFEYDLGIGENGGVETLKCTLEWGDCPDTIAVPHGVSRGLDWVGVFVVTAGQPTSKVCGISSSSKRASPGPVPTQIHEEYSCKRSKSGVSCVTVARTKERGTVAGRRSRTLRTEVLSPVLGFPPHECDEPIVGAILLEAYAATSVCLLVLAAGNLYWVRSSRCLAPEIFHCVLPRL
ncbi:hypothetical protein Tco_0800801 [Tanacetum coccineum]|uniref:Uncharacterized protein n=1 Tax=Tanacetum coccineum TaxID=301880 RepID=A0ABQ4ZYL1_9ASTR